MAVTAASIVRSAHEILQDLAGVYWPATELVRYMNEAQREIARLRPDQKTVTRDESLVAGARQTLAADVQALIDIPRNTTSKNTIRKVDMFQLDAVVSGWQAAATAADIIHFMHDMRDPRTFYVYPPASNGQQVNATFSLYPTAVADPSGPTYTGVTGNIDLPDHWATPILNYMLFRAFSKDAEYGGNAAEAVAYKALFDAATGEQLQSTAAVAPKN